MPVLSKKILSNYFRSNCKRRLALDLWPDVRAFRAEREALGMPPRFVGRPGITLLSRQGTEWEEAKVADLELSLGQDALIGTRTVDVNGAVTYQKAPLLSLLPRGPVADRFIVQPQFTVRDGSSFESSLGISSLRVDRGLQFADFRPDLIQLLGRGRASTEVLPGGLLRTIGSEDPRQALRIIDIKLTAEPSNAYFAEVALYSMALAGWLVDERLDGQYFVASSAAIWPGSHEASNIVKVTTEKRAAGGASRADLFEALEEDLIQVPFDVFAARLRRFFKSELPEVLSTPWEELPWHVDSRCSGCDFLGYDWGSSFGVDPKHCWPLAEAEGHLSRVAFVTNGARSVLEENSIDSVPDLAALSSDDDILRQHQGLRASKTVVTSRAQSLVNDQVVSPPDAGTSAIMPRWADLRMYVSADFDIGSGITSCFGLKSFFYDRQTGSGTPQSQAVEFPIESRDPLIERRELIRFLDRMDQEIKNVLPSATIQIYIWDSVTYDHLVRVLGRHLPWLIGNNDYKKLVWLFPPEEVIRDPEQSDRKSPVCIVRDVVKAVAAVPVPHYYSLLSVARVFHDASVTGDWAEFRVPSLFEDPLSDQVPSERIHEVWAREPNWSRALENLKRTVRTKLRALEAVTRRLEQELVGQLKQTAPRIQDLGSPSLPNALAPDSRLWFLYSKLNVALQKLEVQQGRAMPEHEREARFRSALLTRRITGIEERNVLAAMGIVASPPVRVYRMRPDSREVKAKEGDFTFCLTPFGDPAFLETKVKVWLDRLGLDGPALGIREQSMYLPMEKATQVTVRGLDRENLVLVVELSGNWYRFIDALEASGQLDLTSAACLDPTFQEFFIKRLEATLKAIGNPPTAVPSPALALALGARNRQRAGTSASTPASEVLWNAPALAAQSIARDRNQARARLEASGITLNDSQWLAWEEALSKRLTLIWGPPGTGKSKTLRSIIAGAAVSAESAGEPLRILITGPTYEAIDNVLRDSITLLNGPAAVPANGGVIRRLRSSYSEPCRYDVSIDCESGSQAWNELATSLAQPGGLTAVAGTPQQVHRLLDSSGSPVAPFFDIVIIDEASQLDVAQSTLILAGLSNTGSLIVAGDPKQLPPIHPGEPPSDFEDFVGPIFSYLESRHGIRPKVLLENYRSNQDIVSIGYGAGYPRELVSVNPGMRLRLSADLPVDAPQGWPMQMQWSSNWSAMLDPTKPASLFLYSDGRSCQSNRFEADSVAALIALARLTAVDPDTGLLYEDASFWSKAVGVVTPHRAQQALVVQRLQAAFPGTPPAMIRASVDTVERFQGQERQLIIASYAVGDPDAIGAEETFLMSLNRFNVAVSRPKTKLIVLLTRELVDHLASDADALEQSGLLKYYAESYCSNESLMLLPSPAGPDIVGEFRWH